METFNNPLWYIIAAVAIIIVAFQVAIWIWNFWVWLKVLFALILLYITLSKVENKQAKEEIGKTSWECLKDHLCSNPFIKNDEKD